METLLELTLLLALFELIEALLQRAPTLGGVIERLYYWYQKSIFLFLGIHLSFVYTLFVVIVTDRLNMAMIVILAMKVFDIFYKIEIIRTLYIKKESNPELEMMLSWRLPSWFFLTGLLLYPPMLYYALS